MVGQIGWAEKLRQVVRNHPKALILSEVDNNGSMFFCIDISFVIIKQYHFIKFNL